MRVLMAKLRRRKKRGQHFAGLLFHHGKQCVLKRSQVDVAAADEHASRAEIDRQFAYVELPLGLAFTQPGGVAERQAPLRVQWAHAVELTCVTQQ